MSKKHFIAAAKQVAAIINIEDRITVARNFAELFQQFSPQFDRQRFFAACDLP